MKVIATLVAVDLGRDLVGTDVLGDATGLLVDDVGVAQRVEELGLAVVDVTHDGHDRRTDDEVALVALVLTELEVEGLEQLAVLVLGRDDLDDVVELLAEQLERLVVDRLGRGHHLAEREQHLHQRRPRRRRSSRRSRSATRHAGSRTVSPLPLRTRTPPIVGASMSSNS